MPMLGLLIACCWTVAAALGPDPPLPDECERECGSAGPPVCGDDGHSYQSECELAAAGCRLGLQIGLKHGGSCNESSSCASRRAFLLRSPGLFAPACDEGGGYAPVQCHPPYCWCVDERGKPVRGTSTRNPRPACSHKGKKNNQRRSSRRKKGCSPSDRMSFNSNLIKIFESEYKRVAPSDADASSAAASSWKFESLDADGDGLLGRAEVGDLRRMARRIVPPRACARTFASFCDADRDRALSRHEWQLCTGVTQAPGQLQEGSWKREDSMPQLSEFSRDPNEESSQEEADPQDCVSARAAALEVERQAPGAGTYVPECAPSGLYARAQCHRSPPYCWCVHPRTGRPVRGTATQGVKPDCDLRTKSLKGCSLHKKQEFLDELIQFFTKEMQEDARNKSLHIPVPSAEKAARWKFAESDANGNEVLEKAEWKVFRSEWKGLLRDKRRLRKCYRNLPRFCDENDDHAITVDEWLACTVTTRDSRRNIPRNSRRGKNPLTTILKSD